MGRKVRLPHYQYKSSIKRLGPDEYDGTKAQYRRIIWRTFREYFANQVANVNVLLMPSIEGDEIETALNNGFREPNIHAVDWNRAIVATLKRKYRHINTYGIALSRAASRIADQEVKLGAANFDFCNALGRPLSLELHETLCHIEPEIIGVTMLKGRERRGSIEHIASCGAALRPVLTEVWPTWSDEDLGRVIGVQLALSNFWWRIDRFTPKRVMLGDLVPANRVQLLRAGSYRSSNGIQDMIWSIWRLEYPEDALEVGHAYNAAYYDFQFDRFEWSEHIRGVFSTQEEAIAFHKQLKKRGRQL